VRRLTGESMQGRMRVWLRWQGLLMLRLQLRLQLLRLGPLLRLRWQGLLLWQLLQLRLLRRLLRQGLLLQLLRTQRQGLLRRRQLLRWMRWPGLLRPQQLHAEGCYGACTSILLLSHSSVSDKRCCFPY